MKLTDIERILEDYEAGLIFNHELPEVLREAPTVEAEPVIHARWEICEEPNTVDTYGNPEKYARCTHCGFGWSDVYSVKNYFKRCPECGAYMKGAEQQ